MNFKVTVRQIQEVAKMYGDLTAAAAACGVSERTFRRWLKGTKPTRLGRERIQAVLTAIRQVEAL